MRVTQIVTGNKPTQICDSIGAAIDARTHQIMDARMHGRKDRHQDK